MKKVTIIITIIISIFIFINQISGAENTNYYIEANDPTTVQLEMLVLRRNLGKALYSFLYADISFQIALVGGNCLGWPNSHDPTAPDGDTGRGITDWNAHRDHVLNGNGFDTGAKFVFDRLNTLEGHMSASIRYDLYLHISNIIDYYKRFKESDSISLEEVEGINILEIPGYKREEEVSLYDLEKKKIPIIAEVQILSSYFRFSGNEATVLISTDENSNESPLIINVKNAIGYTQRPVSVLVFPEVEPRVFPGNPPEKLMVYKIKIIFNGPITEPGDSINLTLCQVGLKYIKVRRDI